MSAFKNLVEKAIWKVARNLIRDYAELELLQSGSKAPSEFVERSLFRAKETFTREFELLRFTSIQFSDNYKPNTVDGVHLVIYPLDGMHNLMRAFPFFGSTLLQIKRQNGEEQVTAAVISLPALSQLYFAEKGQGAWMEKYEDSGRNMARRLRVSNARDFNLAIVSDSFQSLTQIKANVRNFGSKAYDISCYASGRLDAIAIEAQDRAHRHALELFALEAGGVVRSQGNGNLIATNSLLAPSIK